MNQSSFISEMGRKSILKHLENESIKIIKNEQKKSKKCLAKMKNIFPSDFFWCLINYYRFHCFIKNYGEWIKNLIVF